MLVQNAPEFVSKYIPTIVQRLTTLIGAPDSRSDENVMATDNAVSALGKILEKFPTQCDAGKLWYVSVLQDRATLTPQSDDRVHCPQLIDQWPSVFWQACVAAVPAASR